MLHWRIRGKGSVAVQFLSSLCTSWQKCQIIDFRPKLRGWRPLWKILELLVGSGVSAEDVGLDDTDGNGSYLLNFVKYLEYFEIVKYISNFFCKS